MDLREKLIELLDEVHHKPLGKEYLERLGTIADCLITNGVTVRDVPDTNVRKWIPVTERLPEDNLPKGSKVKQIKVLVAYKTNERWVTRTQIRAKGYWYGEPDKWSWVKTSNPITHWMPLPEPPKEGE